SSASSPSRRRRRARRARGGARSIARCRVVSVRRRASQFLRGPLTRCSCSTQGRGTVTRDSPAARLAAPDDALLAALDATVARARGSALYRERPAGVRIGSLDDLAALPLTSRADLQAAGPHGTPA